MTDMLPFEPPDETAACDRCAQRRPLQALFAITYGPQPWDATEHRAVLCVPCHGAVTEQIEHLEALAARAIDDDAAEMELGWNEAALHNTVFSPARARVAKEQQR